MSFFEKIRDKTDEVKVVLDKDKEKKEREEIRKQRLFS
jgi:hypothetical protein